MKFAPVTDDLIDALLNSNSFLEEHTMAIKCAQNGSRLLKIGKEQTQQFLSTTKQVTVATRTQKNVVLVFRLPPVPKPPRPIGTRMTFTQVPDAVVTGPDVEKKVAEWAQELIQFDTGNVVLEAAVAKPTRRPHIVTDKVNVTFKHPPRTLVANEASALMNGERFTRNTTMDDNFDAPRYMWSSRSLKCSHCHVCGHSVSNCPVQEIDWNPPKAGLQNFRTSIPQSQLKPVTATPIRNQEDDKYKKGIKDPKRRSPSEPSRKRRKSDAESPSYASVVTGSFANVQRKVEMKTPTVVTATPASTPLRIPNFTTTQTTNVTSVSAPSTISPEPVPVLSKNLNQDQLNVLADSTSDSMSVDEAVAFIGSDWNDKHNKQ